MRDFFVRFPIGIVMAFSGSFSFSFSFSDGTNGSNGANGTNGSMGLIKKADINKRYARTLYNKQCSVAFPISASLGAQSVLR